MLVLGLTLAATAALGAKQSVTLKVSPAMSFAPATLVIRTQVDPDADNRSLEVITESADFYRSSMVSLDGDRAPKTTQLEYHSLPPGEYVLEIKAGDQDGDATELVGFRVTG
jgi:hypothetical protein